MLLAPPESIAAQTKKILEQLGGRGHILNLGHGILPNTPVEAAQSFIRTGQEYSFSKGNTAANF
jgi:uroporphyrinogen decarboxylase